MNQLVRARHEHTRAGIPDLNEFPVCEAGRCAVVFRSIARAAVRLRGVSAWCDHMVVQDVFVPVRGDGRAPVRVREVPGLVRPVLQVLRCRCYLKGRFVAVA